MPAWEEQDSWLCGSAVVARRMGVKEVQVLIAGGGPVGMTLACDLEQIPVT